VVETVAVAAVVGAATAAAVEAKAKAAKAEAVGWREWEWCGGEGWMLRRFKLHSSVMIRGVR